MRAIIDIPRGRRFVQAAVTGLTALNVELMKRRPYPFLYKTGVRYAQDPPGVENWRNADKLLAAKRGDCEDLAAYMAAWLIVNRGTRAFVYVYRSAPKRLHAVVCLPSTGRVLDPSRKLGMGRKRR